jgi:hypothetical protein
MNTEIVKLNEMLCKADIPHTFMRMDKNAFGVNAFQICIYQDNSYQKVLDDVVFHKYSHGYDLGLLETYGLSNCEGYETAEEVFKGWMEKYFS